MKQYATLEDTVYFWFAANDTSGSGGDGASPAAHVRLAGAAADAAPVLSPTPTLLSHVSYPAGCYEVAVAATTGNGFAANNTYAVFCTLLVDSQNPSGFVGSFDLKPVLANITQLLGTAWLTPTVAGTPDVNTKTITDGAITAAKLGADCITSAKIADDALANEHFAAGALTATEITGAAGCAVSSIGNNVITAASINADAITEAKIADNAIAAEHLNATACTKIIDNFETQSQADPTGFHVNVKEVNGTAQTAGDVVALANSSAAWGYINSGMVFRGIASEGTTTTFVCGGLADQGAGAFVDVNTPWYAYVFRDAGGVGGAPQGETRTVTSYTTATGAFEVSEEFSAAIGDGDDIIIMSGRIAAIPEVLADTNELQADWVNGGRLDLILDIIAADTTTDIPAKLLKYVQLLARSDTAIATDNATELTAINADGGSGAGDFSNQTEAVEALRDHIGNGTNLTEAGGDGDHLTAINLPNQTMDITGNITGNLSGSVGSLTGHTVQTGDSFAIVNHADYGNAKLARTGADSDTLETLSDQIDDCNTTTPPTVGEIQAEMEENGASILDTLRDDLADGGRLDLLIDAIKALLDDARGEPGQGAPPVNPDLATKIDYLYKAWRNLKDNDGTTRNLYNDAGDTVDQKSSVSEAAGTVTIGEIVSGP